MAGDRCACTITVSDTSGVTGPDDDGTFCHGMTDGSFEVKDSTVVVCGPDGGDLIAHDEVRDCACEVAGCARLDGHLSDDTSVDLCATYSYRACGLSASLV